MARLIISQGPGTGTIHPLRKDILTLGRDEKCGVRLVAEGVSRNHAQVIRENTRWLITDLMSKNGTVVNGEKVEQRELVDGDTIKVGDVVLVFSEEGEEPTAKAGQASAPTPVKGDDIDIETQSCKYVQDTVDTLFTLLCETRYIDPKPVSKLKRNIAAKKAGHKKPKAYECLPSCQKILFQISPTPITRRVLNHPLSEFPQAQKEVH